MDAVSQVLASRDRDVDGLQRMLGWSVLAHVVLVAAVALMPAGWLGTVASEEPDVVMSISLGGAPGPRAGGMTTLGGRPVQEVRPVEAKKTVEAVRPPAARQPEMVEPTKKAPRRTETPTKTEARDPRGRTPTRGEEVRQGSSVAETGGRGQGFGLTQGGGGSSGYLDVANFCCPEYLSTMLDLINRNWSSKQQAAGTTVVKFVIRRDGQLTDVVVEKPSGYAALDLLAQRAVMITRQLPPLPAAFTEPSLTVHLVFEYQR